MKRIFVSFCMLICLAFSVRSQTGIIILTEKYTNSHPLTDTVFVIDGSGNIVATPITHPENDIIQHDADLNVLINNIVNQGYQQMEFYPYQDTVPTWNNTRFINSIVRRIYFGIP